MSQALDRRYSRPTPAPGLSILSLVRPDLFLILLTMPFQWYRLSFLGNRSAVWIPTIFAVAVLAFRPVESWKQLQRFFFKAPIVHFLWVFYLVVITASGLLGPHRDAAFPKLTTAYSQFAFYLIVGTILMSTSLELTSRTVLMAVPCGLIAFVVYCNFVFASQGQSLVVQLTTAATSGQSNAIAGKVLLPIVTHQYSQLPYDRQLEMTGSIRNTISATLLTFLFFVLVLPRIPELRSFQKTTTLFTSTCVPFIMFVLMSRATSILLIASPLICGFLYMLSRRKISSQTLIAVCFGLALTICFLVVVGALAGDNDFVELNRVRMKSISEDPRIYHYRLVIREIIESPWIGYGLGADTPDGRQVHNFFLGTWFRAGMIGLGISVAYYLALVGYSIRASMLQQLSFWLPALMLVPLFRTPWIGGNDGRFTRIEFLAIATFIYFCDRAAVKWSAEPADGYDPELQDY